MGSGAINFGNNQASGDAALAGASPLAVNVLVDGAGAVRRRPGLSAWSGFPSSIPVASEVTGIQEFEGDVYWVNAFREIRKVAPATATHTNVTGTTATAYLDDTGRPVFAVTPYRMVIAGGGLMEKVDSGETLAERLGGSPADATWVSHLASRLFANDRTSSSTSNHIRFSDVGILGEELWDALDFGAAEADPDAVTFGRTTASNLWIWGSRSLEIFEPDPINIMARAVALPVGCLAPHSVIRMDDAFAWFDNQRRFVMCDGRSYDEISGPIAATLDGITTVSDCYGFRLNAEQYDTMVWVFPTDGRSFCYQRGGGWSQWHGWTVGAGHALYPVKSHHYYETGGVHLAGLSSGQIAKFDTAAYTDMGTAFKSEALTGFENRGTTAPKQCEVVRFTVKRGTTSAGSTAPALLYSWRDNDGEAFCQPIRVDLGTAGDYVSTVEVRGLGVYRQRQHRIEMTEAADLTLARVEEEWSDGG